MIPQPPFDSQPKSQQLANAFTIMLQQQPALRTLWLIVVQSLNKDAAIPRHARDSWLALLTVALPPYDPMTRFETFGQYLCRCDPAWMSVVTTATGSLWLMELAEQCAKGPSNALTTAILNVRSTSPLPSVRNLAKRFAEALQRSQSLKALWMLAIRGVNPRYAIPEQVAADPFFWLGERTPSHTLEARMAQLERWLPTLAPDVIRDIPDVLWQVWLKDAALRCATRRYRNPWRPWIDRGRAKGSGQFRDAKEFRACMRILILEFYKAKRSKPAQRDLALLSATSPHSPSMSERAIRRYCYDTFDETTDLDCLIQEVLQEYLR